MVLYVQYPRLASKQTTCLAVRNICLKDAQDAGKRLWRPLLNCLKIDSDSSRISKSIGSSVMGMRYKDSACTMACGYSGPITPEMSLYDTKSGKSDCSDWVNDRRKLTI